MKLIKLNQNFPSVWTEMKWFFIQFCSNFALIGDISEGIVTNSVNLTIVFVVKGYFLYFLLMPDVYCRLEVYMNINFFLKNGYWSCGYL